MCFTVRKSFFVKNQRAIFLQNIGQRYDVEITLFALDVFC